MHRVTFQVVVLLAWCFVWSTCQVEANSVNRRFYRHAIRLCSKSLSDALSLVCKDGYAGFEQQQQPGGTSAETHHKGANHEPGIVELCCYQPCNIETLEQYCIKPVAHPKT